MLLNWLNSDNTAVFPDYTILKAEHEALLAVQKIFFQKKKSWEISSNIENIVILHFK